MLYLAARESESGVEAALAILIDEGREISVEVVEAMLAESAVLEAPREVAVEAVDLASYDELLEGVCL